MKKPLIMIFLLILALAVASMALFGTNGQLTVMNSSYSGRGQTASMPAVGEASNLMIRPDKGYPLPPMGGGDALTVADRVYEYNSYHSVIVDDVSSYVTNLKEYIKNTNGVILSVSQSRRDDTEYAAMYAKVPVSSFDQATKKVTENVEKIVTESINTADRTGEVVNTADQVAALNQEIAIKQAQLKEATLQSEKNRIQNEIEMIQKKVTALQEQNEAIQEQVEYATVNVTASDDEGYFDPNGQQSLWQVLKDALKSVKGSLYSVVVLFIWVAVYSVILIPAYVAFKWVRGRYVTNKQ